MISVMTQKNVLIFSFENYSTSASTKIEWKLSFFYSSRRTIFNKNFVFENPNLTLTFLLSQKKKKKNEPINAKLWLLIGRHTELKTSVCVGGRRNVNLSILPQWNGFPVQRTRSLIIIIVVIEHNSCHVLLLCTSKHSQYYFPCSVQNLW